MKKAGIFRRLYWILALALAIVCMAEVRETNAKESEDRVIRVGYIEQCGFIEMEEHDHTQHGYTGYHSYPGYGVEFLDKIAEYTGWTYEYVADTWENCVKKLEAGEIDLICNVQYREHWTDRFLFSSLPLGYEYTSIYVRPDAEIYYEDYEGMNGCKVGMLRLSALSDSFLKLAEEQKVDFEAVWFDTEREILEALEAEKIDAAVTSSLHVHSGVKTAARYDAMPYYFITSVEDADIMRQIDEAMQKIRIEAEDFWGNLTEKYYGNNKISSGPLFTRDEMEYINAAAKVHVKLMEGTKPLSYVKDGEPGGIMVRHLKLLEKYSGLDFLIEMETNPITIEEFTTNCAEGEYLIIRAERALDTNPLYEELITTNTLLETKLAYVKRKDAFEDTGRNDFVFAITKEKTYLEHFLIEESENYRILYCDTYAECLESVIEKKADIAIMDSYMTYHLLQKPRYADYLMECQGGEFKNSMCLIASENQEILIRIINKTIDFISEQELEDAVTKELFENPYDKTFADYIYQEWQVFILVAAGIVVGLVLYFIFHHKITEMRLRRKEYEILQKKVQQDELTGILNRPYFYEKAKEMILASEEPMCIILMDISNFKVVNDLYGMRIGDKLLRYVARELTELGKDRNFIVGRFTGDHFYMCMTKRDFEEISFPKRFKTFLQDMEVLVSYGVFLVEDQKDIPVNIMCDRANIAVHDNRRNQAEYIHYYNDEERQRMIMKQEIENDMEKALEGRQFCVYVQPKYDIATRKIVGGEALVRWKHPQKGMIPPGEFINVFEKNGFIVRLDHYVWEETCRLLAEQKKQGVDTKPISINVSRIHFYGNELRSKLSELIEKYELSSEDLEIEITETIAADDTDMIYEKIRSLQAKGFRVAMDDFGSGYSSLNMLKEMPLDVVKMDLKFLDAKGNEEKSRKILRTLIKLVQRLELKVVVEGVETEEQTEFLDAIGKCQAQGYFFSKPVDTETYTNMLCG